MRRRRRWVSLAFVAVALAVWFLVGRPGLNWSESGSRDPDTQGPDGDREGTGIRLASNGPVPGPPAASETTTEPPEKPAEPPTEPPIPAADRAAADRLGARAYRLREALTTGRLGAACVEFDAITAMRLPDSLSGRRKRIETQLREALAAAPIRLREQLTAGRVLETRASIEAIRATPHADVEPILAAIATLATLDALPVAAPPTATATAPAPLGADALPEGRIVRIRFRDGWHTGRIAGHGGSGYTVKIATPDGVYFPVKQPLDLEPVQPTWPDITRQVTLALATPDRLTAALWLAHAHTHTDRDTATLAEWRRRL